MSVLIMPVQNELFSSWLYRQGAVSIYSDLSIHQLLGMYQCCMQKGDFDPDFNFSSEFSRCALKQLGLVDSDVFFFAPKSTWLMPRYYRGAFCYECFCDHIRSFKLPTMLTEWCSVTQTVCPVHFVSLVDTPGKHNYKLNMAVRLFSDYHSQSSSLAFPHPNLTPQVIDALLSMQLFMSSAEARALDSGCDSEWRLIQTIMRIFLYPRHGIIASLFPKKSVGAEVQLFRYNLHLGPLTSQVTRRQLAILLMGLVLDVLEDSQRSEAEQYLKFFDQRYYFFNSTAGLGRSANVFIPEHGRSLFAQLVELSTKIRSPYLAEFVAGFGGRH
ncbi:hypothetical protein [Pseudomonas viridiflava]|uniref:hypothetical protein n=1 Tax=Pseudomonas viridiflava TaxID=33069 RepID=UPI001BD0F3D3|nr:hypothetical protein [Pseudomonas viridiflava]QVI83405.1 hypothetical protein KHW14_13690 [Pseudomonas viridiflava]